MDISVDSNNNERYLLPVKVWGWLLAGVFLVRAPFLFYFGMSTDAYTYIDRLPEYSFLAGQGRPGAYLLVHFLHSLALYGPVQQYADLIITLPVLCITGVLLLASVFDASRTDHKIFIVGALLFLAHPYNAEILTFRDAAPFYAIGSLLGVAGYYLAVVRRRYLLGMGCIVLGLTIYQTFLNFLAISWLLSLILSLSAPKRLELTCHPNMPRLALRGLLVIIASLLTYFLVIKFFNVIGNTHQNGRATFISLGELPQRLRDAGTILLALLHGDLIVNAILASVLTMTMVLAGMLAVVLDGTRPLRFLVAPVGWLLCFVASIGVILIGRDFWPMPRVLVAVALLPAFGFVLATSYFRGALRRGMWVAATLLLVAYTAISSLVAADQIRNNRRDMVMAAAVAGRMSLTPHQHVAMVGGPDSSGNLLTVHGDRDMNLSAYWPYWSRTAALSEFYGYPLALPSEQEYARAEAYCRTADLWPSFASTTLLSGGLAVICLSRPGN
jgi:hypothetical protein